MSAAPPQAQRRLAWHALDAQAVARAVDGPADGLTEVRARERLALYGPNELAAAGPRPPWQVLARQFASPLILLLVVAAAVTAVQRHWIDVAAISLVVALNAAIGYWQERKAEKDVRALASLAVPTARVLRSGTASLLPSARLVPGDLVLLESGDKVPADLRLVEGNGLRVDESMLTGESEAVDKDAAAVGADASLGERRCMAYTGTLVVSGRARGVVVATGTATELGAISGLVSSVVDKTPLQILTATLERRIGWVVSLAAALVFAAGLLQGKGAAEMFRTAVALAVSAIPESLPVGLTIALSIGVSRMARHRAIVRSLPAVETLGSTDVIGSDKTGTLTVNRMTVERLWTPEGVWDATRPEDPGGPPRVARLALRAGALSNEALPDPTDPGGFLGDPVDAAMARIAVVSGAASPAERAAAPLHHVPYEPRLRLCRTVRDDGAGGRIAYAKGAPDAIAALCGAMEGPDGPLPLDPELIDAANEQFARDGLRVIATAHGVLRDGEPVDGPPAGGMVFLGLEAMADPPREGVAEAVAACRDAGIRVAMITGDQPATAAAIGRRLGIEPGDSPVTGAEMAALDDEALALRLRHTSIAARVSPEDKLRIVQVLQAEGHTVAVTGDGVNDAPALRAASIGVAMGRGGTDVAREAADVVLTDDDFVTIVEAVRQGRVTFSAIRKVTFFLLASAVASLLAVSVNVFTDHPLIFLPVQILWINLVTNGIQDIALAFEPEEGNQLERAPRPPTEGLLTGVLWWRTILTGAFMATAVLLMFGWAVEHHELPHARTLALTLFAVLHFFVAMTARSERLGFHQVPFFGNPWLLAAAAASLGLHAGVMNWTPIATAMGMTALSPGEWLVCLGLGSTVFVVVEIEKALRRRVPGAQGRWRNSHHRPTSGRTSGT
ncbi:cation-translocating P-type ATPase [Zafaria sp. Z1313]|uniref:cation-translocating P-type ATPase n=1 Tax=unclassified Zafaria TaxID=2828765 RepID=UPI002E76AC65|nr:HAD-IC family P-type ATPase [Zafaria sp. J156]MEE1621944.1 HAD-IC family P-type ATPase [Zafaria sp. J156]